jgi:hypothetical protein
MDKKIIFKLVIFFWIVFSVVFILYDVWSDFKTKELNQAYQSGGTDTVNYLIQQAKNCQVVPVRSGDTQIQVVDTSCLKTENANGK